MTSWSLACAFLVAALSGPAGPAPAPAPSAEFSGSAFEIPVAGRHNPYGPRPSTAPKLSADVILRYALQNPAIKAADEEVNAMKAQLQKAKFGWLPIIETTVSLSPGVSIKCDDIPVQTTGENIDFQWCRPGGNNPSDLDVQTVSGYFRQLNDAGVRFSIDANVVFPITTFGKRWAARDLGRHAVALSRLKKEQVRAQTTLLVQQAHATVLVAREAIHILETAHDVLEKAKSRVLKDLGGSEDFDADLSEGNPDRDPDDMHRVGLTEVALEEKMREARKIEALALSALWALAGDEAPRGFDLAEPVLTPTVLRDGLTDLETYKREAIRSRPEAKMARAGVAIRQAQQKLARRNFLPDLGVVVNLGFARSSGVDPDMYALYYNDRFNYSRASAALALRWRMDFHNKTFDLRHAQAKARSADYQREAAEIFLQREVEEAYLNLQEASFARVQHERAVDLAWKLVVSQQQRDMVGGGNSKDLMKALKDWYEWRFRAAETVLNYNLAVSRLSRAVGTALAAPPGAKVPDPVSSR